MNNDDNKAVKPALPLSRWFEAASQALGGLVVLEGCAVLAGWFFNISVLQSFIPHEVALKPNTALCFALIGAGLLLLNDKKLPARLNRILTDLAAYLVLAVSLIMISEYLFGWNSGIDPLLLSKAQAATFPSFPGRISLNSSLIFALIGSGLFLIRSKRQLLIYSAQIMVFIATVISLIAFAGHIYGAPPLIIGAQFSTSMSLYAMVLSLSSCAGFYFARPKLGLMNIVSSRTTGGRMLRTILPVAILTPLTVGWLKILAQSRGLISNEIGVAFVAIINLLVTSAFIYIFAALVNKKEKDMIESEERFRKIFEDSSDALMLLSDKGFFDCNERALEMFCVRSKEEFVKLHPAELSPPFQPDGKESFPAASEHILAAMRDGSRKFEWVHRRGGIADFPAEVLLSAFHHNGQKVLQATVRDISERRAAEIAVKENMEAKGRFLSLVSHELRTPLTAIKEGISIVEEGATGEINAEQKDFLSTAKRNVERLSRLINDVLDFNKLEAGKMIFRFAEHDINKVIKDVVDIQKNSAEAKGIYLKAAIGGDIGLVSFDADKIMQVLTNLINNAVKFTEKGGVTVSSRLEAEGKLLRVAVEDTGAGIAKDDIPKLFEEFLQVGAGIQKPGSTGLGLAISKEIIEKHKGRIWIESELGKGTRFIFEIPGGRNG